MDIPLPGVSLRSDVIRSEDAYHRIYNNSDGIQNGRGKEERSQEREMKRLGATKMSTNTDMH